jgi:DNA (cytosine-5)-methyltransferase 1
MKERLKVIDLFAGSGGLSYGFMKDPAFELLCAVEILTDMAKSFEFNHPGVKVYDDDIANFNRGLFERDFEIKASEVDIIIGGPPCQAYSTIGKRLQDDPRAKLFQEYFRLLEEFMPSFFIFENVRGLMTIDQGELLENIKDLFSTLGYHVEARLLNAADFGVPQHRKRIIIIGTLFNKKFQYPKPTHGETMQDLFSEGLLPYVTLSEALSDLPLIGNDDRGLQYSSEPRNDYQKKMRETSNGRLNDHDSPKNGEKLIRIMQSLPQGGTLKDIPKEFRPTKAFGNSYSRLWWNQPSTTLTRNFGTPSSARCIHPLVPRALTTREGARLQSFPDDYTFLGGRGSKNLQIGNAVPPLLSIHLAAAVKHHFWENEK